MRKYVILLFVLIAFSRSGYCQFITTLTVNQPSATFTEWYNNTTVIYVVESQSTAQRQVIIKAELKTTDGTIVASKDLSKAQVFTLQRGTRVFYAKDILPVDLILFNGSYKKTLEKTGKLPSGTYQLEVQLVEPGIFMPLSTLQTRVFNLTAPQLPYLIMPSNNDTLGAKKAETAIIFRWTPLIPKTQDQPYYRLQVFEVYSYQQPLQALRGNQPLLDQLIKSQTQFIWRPQLAFTTDSISKKFIWTVQTLNSNQQPYIQTDGNGESRSEPFIFMIRNK